MAAQQQKDRGPISDDVYILYIKLWDLDAISVPEEAEVLLDSLDTCLLDIVGDDVFRHLPSPFGGAITRSGPGAALEAAETIIKDMTAKNITASIGVTAGHIERVNTPGRRSWNVVSTAINLAARIAWHESVRGHCALDESSVCDGRRIQGFGATVQARVKTTDIAFRIAEDAKWRQGPFPRRLFADGAIRANDTLTHVVLFDVAGFSSKNQVDQRHIVDLLSWAVESSLLAVGIDSTQGERATPYDGMIRDVYEPSGDGGYCIFPTSHFNGSRVWTFATVLRDLAGSGEIALRIGLTTGYTAKTRHRLAVGQPVIVANDVSNYPDPTVGEIAVHSRFWRDLNEAFRKLYRSSVTADANIIIVSRGPDRLVKQADMQRELIERATQLTNSNSRSLSRRIDDLLPSRVRSAKQAPTTAVIEVINRYYDKDSLLPFSLYSFMVNRSTINTVTASRPGWTGLSIPLDNAQELCSYDPKPFRSIKLAVDEDRLARYLADALQSRIWDADLYRLREVNINDVLTMRFGGDRFLNYRIAAGILEDELTEALAYSSPADVVNGRSRLLPIRSELLSNGESLESYETRMCAGGVLVCFAMKRPVPYDDYVITLLHRSADIGESPELLSITPGAFHQPTVDARLEVALSSTVYREIYEELFGGIEATRDVTLSLEPGWFFGRSKPIAWLKENRESVTMECTAMTFGLLRGNYEVMVLVAVHDSEFYWKFLPKLNGNWEVDWENRKYLSTTDTDGIVRTLLTPGWATQTLVSLVEGLRRLETIDQQRASHAVRLPTIVWPTFR